MEVIKLRVIAPPRELDLAPLGVYEVHLRQFFFLVGLLQHDHLGLVDVLDYRHDIELLASLDLACLFEGDYLQLGSLNNGVICAHINLGLVLAANLIAVGGLVELCVS